MYPDYEFQQRSIEKLSQRCRVAVIGKSLCGRSIYALYTGSGRKCPLIAAGFHGTEYLTVLAALRFAFECSQSAVIIPCVNPDGTEIAIHGADAACRYRRFVRQTGAWSRWQANARGVDINHNFDADWENVKRRERETGIFNPEPTRFGGCCPESEPETRALTRLCRKNRFLRVLALHSQGREIYWNFGDCTPAECKSLAEKMASVSGYKVASPEPLAVGGGFKDWFIAAFHRCGYTVEMGLGKNPLPLSDFETEYPAVERILSEFLSGGKYAHT